MKKKLELRIDRWMRTIHLYTGLFLIPWVIVYATSGFLLNHRGFFAEQFGVGLTSWEVLKEVPYSVAYDPGKTGKEKAKQVLQFLGLDGPYWIINGSNSHEFLINRASPKGEYLLSWLPDQSLIIVEQKTPFSIFELVHFLHFTHDYDQGYFSQYAWSTTVDLFIISLLFWMVSGIYIWMVKKKKPVLGAVFLGSGVVVFSGILVVMWQ